MDKKKNQKYNEITEVNSNNIKDIVNNCINPYMINSRDRPYDGQPHTNSGLRGKELVKGLTFRDICDCMIKGILLSSLNEAVYSSVMEGVWQYRDVYAAGDYDPIAAIQNASCCMEELMIKDGYLDPYHEREKKYIDEYKKINKTNKI